MRMRKAVSIIIACLLLLPAALPSACAEQTAPSIMRDITTMELVREMGIGIWGTRSNPSATGSFRNDLLSAHKRQRL